MKNRENSPQFSVSRPDVGSAETPVAEQSGDAKRLAVATGGVLGAIAASSCCLIPLLLVSIGVGGSWIGTLTSLAPYQPIFAVLAIGLIGYGFYMVHRQEKAACEVGGACARPLPNRIVKAALWGAALLVAAAILFNLIAPFIFGSS